MFTHLTVAVIGTVALWAVIGYAALHSAAHSIAHIITLLN
jgi:hypothetical protein